MNYVCVGIFHEFKEPVKYPYTNTMNVFSSPDLSNMKLFLFLFNIEIT